MHPDTLRYYRNRPLTQIQGAKKVSMTLVAQRCSKAQSLHGNDNVPEHDAITFYMLNHAVAEVQRRVTHFDEPLGKYREILDFYHTYSSDIFCRLFTYLHYICTRESRHAHSPESALKGYPMALRQFFKAVNGKSSSSTVSYFKAHAPDCEAATYASALSDVFYKGGFGGGFGGKAWGQVADCLKGYVTGKTSAEVMLDTGWTLAHNNGPIFNKGVVYSHYNSKELQTILDVQRSGQIPQLVAEYRAGSEHVTRVTQEHLSLWDRCHDILGPSFSGFVDWYMVEKLGAVGSYKKQQKAQMHKFGLSPEFKAQEEAKAAAIEAAIIAAQQQEAEFKKNWFVVKPIIKVKKIQLNREEAA